MESGRNSVSNSSSSSSLWRVRQTWFTW